ncbi:unnamed protein product, partial [Porites lobata]
MEERAIHISSINREKRGTSRPGDFTIKFNPSLELDPEKKHQLALDRLSMTYSWYNIRSDYGNNKIKYTHDGTNWQTITFTDGMYSYSDINDYIHQYMSQKSHHSTDSSGKKTYSINLTFILSTYRVLVSLDGDYQLDIRGTKFGDLIGFEKKLINKTEYGSKLPNITNSIDVLNINTTAITDSIVNGINTNTIAVIPTDNLTRNSKLASAIINQSPLTLRLKHGHLRGSDELMLTKRQIDKIKKSIANGTGSDIKISKTQIRKSVKHGGNLFSSLASLGAKVLPYAIKGISKAVPALATGAATALGEIGLNKIFGKGGQQGGMMFPPQMLKKGIHIPPEYFAMLPPVVQEFTKSQMNQINKAYQTGSGVYIKPTRKQIEGGFLGTLASIGIPMAISLVSKIFGGGLQVDRQGSSNTANVYVP